MIEGLVELAVEAVKDTVQDAVQDTVQDVAKDVVEEAGESVLDTIKNAASSLAEGFLDLIDGSDLVPDLDSKSSSKVYKVKESEHKQKGETVTSEKKPYKSRDKRPERALKRKLAKQKRKEPLEYVPSSTP
ncbi:MAG: hypothetical protein MJY85_04735 [Fibrobacter sp.]|nr:hypothetical protein [Fibrobacter sp.]